MKKIIISALLVLALAFTAVAATVTFDIADGDVEGTYQIVATVDDDEGDYRSYANTITFDSNVIVPVNKTNGSVANIAGGKVKSPLSPWSYTYFDEDEGDYQTKTANVKTTTWTAGEDGLYTLVYETYIDEQGLPLDGMAVFSMHFKYADGKSEADITADSFKVDAITYADGGYNYYGRDDEGKATNITVVNNVVPAPVVVVEDWIAGNGYNLVDADKNVVVNNSPVTKTENGKTEVTVKYGGYYQGTDNWSGAALKEAVTVDGLEIEVTYTTLPSSTDCWAYIGVLANPSIFSTKNDAYNNGYVNLIRYSEGNMSVHGTTKWETVGKYGDGFFALKNGDVLRVCFDKNEEGTYDITYVKNNADVFKLPVAIDLETALGDATGYVVASASCLGSKANAFEYTVDVAPEELAIAKIPVAAGDTVYEYTENVSYKATEIAENGTYDVLATGLAYVVVNSGYTAQKVYMVRPDVEGYYVEYAPAANGVLGDDEVSVRVVDPQGIRFFGTIANAYVLEEQNAEYGFIMTAESAYNNLPEDYVLDMALVKAGKAKKGVAHDGNGTDKYFKRDAEATIIAGVLYGIPKTAEGVQTVIVSRPYYKLAPDVYFYGEETKATLYDIAKAIYNVEGYEVAWEYAKEVIELVEGDIDTPVLPELNSEIAIDVSELYK